MQTRHIDQGATLHSAAQSGDIATLNLLIQAGYDVNSYDNQGLTPLHVAAKEGQVDALQILIAAGADLDCSEQQSFDLNQCVLGYTMAGPEGQVSPLQMAIIHGQLEAAEVLINAGASVNQPDSDGVSALQFAIKNGDVAGVELLIAKGADVNYENNEKQYFGNATTALFEAVIKNNFEIANILLKSGARVDIRDYQGESILHRVRSSQLCEILLEAGADVNAVCEAGCSPLIKIISTHYCNHDIPETVREEIVSNLLKAGADVNLVNKDSECALQHAVKGSSSAMCQQLLTAGANPNIVDADGSTLLHYAAQRDNSSHDFENYGANITKLLLQYGVNVNQINTSGMCAIHFAIKNSNVEAIRILKDAGAELEPETICNSPLLYAVKSLNPRVLLELITPGIDFELVREKDKSILHLIEENLRMRPHIQEGFVEVIKALIAVGADVDAVDSENLTVLHHAIINGNLSFVEALVAAGACVNTKRNFAENTALGCAFKKSFVRPEIISVLLEAGVDLDYNLSTDANPKTAFQKALDLIETNERLGGYDYQSEHRKANSYAAAFLIFAHACYVEKEDVIAEGLNDERNKVQFTLLFDIIQSGFLLDNQQKFASYLSQKGIDPHDPKFSYKTFQPALSYKVKNNFTDEQKAIIRTFLLLNRVADSKLSDLPVELLAALLRKVFNVNSTDNIRMLNFCGRAGTGLLAPCFRPLHPRFADADTLDLCYQLGSHNLEGSGNDVRLLNGDDIDLDPDVSYMHSEDDLRLSRI